MPSESNFSEANKKPEIMSEANKGEILTNR